MAHQTSSNPSNPSNPESMPQSEDAQLQQRKVAFNSMYGELLDVYDTLQAAGQIQSDYNTQLLTIITLDAFFCSGEAYIGPNRISIEKIRSNFHHTYGNDVDTLLPWLESHLDYLKKNAVVLLKENKYSLTTSPGRITWGTIGEKATKVLELYETYKSKPKPIEPATPPTLPPVPAKAAEKELRLSEEQSKKEAELDRRIRESKQRAQQQFLSQVNLLQNKFKFIREHGSDIHLKMTKSSAWSFTFPVRCSRFQEVYPDIYKDFETQLGKACPESLVFLHASNSSDEFWNSHTKEMQQKINPIWKKTLSGLPPGINSFESEFYEPVETAIEQLRTLSRLSNTFKNQNIDPVAAKLLNHIVTEFFKDFEIVKALPTLKPNDRWKTARNLADVLARDVRGWTSIISNYLNLLSQSIQAAIDGKPWSLKEWREQYRVIAIITCDEASSEFEKLYTNLKEIRENAVTLRDYLDAIDKAKSEKKHLPETLDYELRLTNRVFGATNKSSATISSLQWISQVASLLELTPNDVNKNLNEAIFPVYTLYKVEPKGWALAKFIDASSELLADEEKAMCARRGIATYRSCLTTESPELA